MRIRIHWVLAALVIAGIVGGCAARTEPQAPAPSVPASVAPSPPVTAGPLPAPSTPAVELVAYFNYKEKMQAAPRTAPSGSKAVLRAALEALLAGPSASEKSGGLSSTIPAGTKLRGVDLAANVAVIDLSREFESGGGTLSMTNRLAQVVFTATQFPGVDAVSFKIEGTRIDVLGGEGIIIDRPQTRKDFEGASPPILVERPGWRGTLRTGTVIRGTANVFEAVFRLELRDSSGKMIMKRSVQATSGTGTRGTWKVTAALGGSKAGIGTLSVFADSPKDGAPIDRVTVPVILSP